MTGVSLRVVLGTLVGITVLIAVMTAAMAVTTRQRGGTTVVLVGLSPSESGLRKAVAECARDGARRAIDEGATLTVAPIASSPADMHRTPIATRMSLETRLTPGKASNSSRTMRDDTNGTTASGRFASRPTSTTSLSALPTFA